MEWFHLSQEPYDSMIKDRQLTMIEPYVPRDNIIDAEGNIPRIPVYNTVSDALTSILGTSMPKVSDFVCHFKLSEIVINPETGDDEFDLTNPYLYRCNEPIDPYLPPDCCEFRKYGQEWYTTPMEFKLLGVIRLDELIYKQRFVYERFHGTLFDHEKSHIVTYGGWGEFLDKQVLWDHTK